MTLHIGIKRSEEDTRRAQGDERRRRVGHA